VGGEQVCWLADKQIMQKESVRRLIRKLKQNGVSPLTDKQRVQSLSVVERPLVAQSRRSRLSVSGGGADMPHRQAEVAF
jgi:hypothetical protein